MKTIHSIVFFVLVLVVVAFIFLILDKAENKEEKILLQTLSCQSDKIDASIYNLKGTTSLIGALIAFDSVPLSEEQLLDLLSMGVVVDEGSLVIDYMYAKIPTASLCDLVSEDYVVRVFTIPEISSL